jgi:RimJ/RimL family protein N-acetyltransferase
MSGRTIVLSGKRVALAVMTEADQPSFQSWLAGNPDLRALIDDHRVPTLEDQQRWFERVRQPDRKFFSLVTVPSGELIGNAGFVDIDASAGTATLRITIGHPDALGKGLGSEAVELLTEYAFSVVRWKLLTLKVLKDNVRAVRTYEKAGFVKTGEDLQDGKTICTMTLEADSFRQHS